jgi:hypothetical protein
MLVRQPQRHCGLPHSRRPTDADHRRPTLGASQPAPQAIHLHRVRVVRIVRRAGFGDVLHSDDLQLLDPQRRLQKRGAQHLK